MNLLRVSVHVAVLLLLPIPLVGVINRIKAVWAGRRGPPILQTFFELRRLLRKRPVYSQVTTALFRVGPLVALATSLVTGLIVPLTGRFAPVSFAFDFVAVAYLWALGRFFLVLSALDTGSSFEGMGASREAMLGALVEPTLFLCLGTLGALTGQSSFAALLDVGFHSPAHVVVLVACALTLFVILQVESARIPVDDPSTHLELTMIHEVMILDHSGPDLAALQYAAALKTTLCAAIVAALLNPVPEAAGPVAAGAAQVGLIVVVAGAVAFVESLMARLKMRLLPEYVVVATMVAFVALLVTAWQLGSEG